MVEVVGFGLFVCFLSSHLFCLYMSDVSMPSMPFICIKHSMRNTSFRVGFQAFVSDWFLFACERTRDGSAF